MEIFKLKTELDSSHVTNTALKETIILKENDIRTLHERIIDVSYRFFLLFLFDSFQEYFSLFWLV